MRTSVSRSIGVVRGRMRAAAGIALCLVAGSIMLAACGCKQDEFSLAGTARLGSPTGKVIGITVFSRGDDMRTGFALDAQGELVYGVVQWPEGQVVWERLCDQPVPVTGTITIAAAADGRCLLFAGQCAPITRVLRYPGLGRVPKMGGNSGSDATRLKPESVCSLRCLTIRVKHGQVDDAG